MQIGSQCWLRENLDVGTMVLGAQEQTDNGTIEKYCYDDNPANCATYGGLYQWNEAMQYDTTARGAGYLSSRLAHADIGRSSRRSAQRWVAMGMH